MSADQYVAYGMLATALLILGGALIAIVVSERADAKYDAEWATALDNLKTAIDENIRLRRELFPTDTPIHDELAIERLHAALYDNDGRWS